MSQEALVALVREVAADIRARDRIEALDDSALAEKGLNDDEIRSIRGGFFDVVLRMGVTLDEFARSCCG